MIKAIISDFDNTLVDFPEAVIPETVVSAVHDYIRKGGIFSIASGRPFVGVIKRESRRLFLKAPLILCGGAGIFNPVTEDILFQQPLPEQEARLMYTLFREQNIEVVGQTAKGLLTLNRKSYDVFGEGISYDSFDSSGFEDILQLDLSPFIVQLTYEKARQLQQHISSTFTDINAHVVGSKGFFGMNITSLRASKHTGVLTFMEYMQLQPEEVAGIGDSYNDYPLLMACGYKVATDDAPPELKEIADLVVPPQSKNGILDLLNKCN